MLSTPESLGEVPGAPWLYLTVPTSGRGTGDCAEVPVGELPSNHKSGFKSSTPVAALHLKVAPLYQKLPKAPSRILGLTFSHLPALGVEARMEGSSVLWAQGSLEAWQRRTSRGGEYCTCWQRARP